MKTFVRHRFTLMPTLALALAVPLAARAEAPAGNPRVLAEARAILQAQYYQELDPARLDLAALRGILTELNGGKPDGANLLLDPRGLAAIKGGLKGEVVGIGTMVDYDEPAGMARVDGVLPGSAAASAGIERGDRILTVDGVGFKGKPLHEVVEAIRGREGSTVKLSLLRGSSTVEKQIVRKKLVLGSVEHARSRDLGLVTLRMFHERTPQELEEALTALAAGGARRLLIDLRGNGGGLFDKSIAAAELLLGRGTEIARTVGRGQKVTKHVGQREAIAGTGKLPVVVLVDRQTASSAEVLAEALRVKRGATLVGEKTYGKWRMETIHPLPEGHALKFTIALVQSPEGKSYDGVGVAPDVEVSAGGAPVEHTRRLPDVEERLAADPQLKAAVHILRRLGGS